MLRVGEFYQIRHNNKRVEIVASGIDRTGDIYADGYEGEFFVGVTRCDRGEWVAEYKPDGTRLWEDDNIGEVHTQAWSLVEERDGAL